MATKGRRIRDLRRDYRLNIEEVEAFLREQNYQCAICKIGIDDRSCVDHDHETGQIRGMLCRTCNSGLGFFRDDPNLLLQAMKYLAYWQGRNDAR